MEKMDFRKLSSEQRNILRLRGINLIKSGKKQKEVALTFGVRASTVSTWMKAYKTDGLKGLKDKSRGVKSEDKKLLSSKQEEKIQRMILDTMPDQLKLPFSLWTRKAVKELVERGLGVVLAINTMGGLSKVLGL